MLPRLGVMPAARSVWPLIGAVTILALGACGGGSDNGGIAGSTSSDAKQIVGVITDSFTTGDPAQCRASNTRRALEQGTGLKGDAAIQACERFAEVSRAESVDVSSISVQGRTASAEVAVTGSELDGQTLALDLVSRDNRWKIDQLTGFVSFDRKALNAGMAESLRRLGITSELRSCVNSGLRQLSDDEVQDIYLSFDKGHLERIIIACAQEERSRSVS